MNKDQQIALRHHDVIALVNKSCQVLIYHDSSDSENDQMKYPRKLTEKYTISKHLGKGSYGEVKLAFRHVDSLRCAVKILEKSEENLDKEIKLLQSIKHKCIVALYDVVDTDDHVYLVLQWANEGEMPKTALPEKVQFHNFAAYIL